MPFNFRLLKLGTGTWLYSVTCLLVQHDKRTFPIMLFSNLLIDFSCFVKHTYYLLTKQCCCIYIWNLAPTSNENNYIKNENGIQWYLERSFLCFKHRKPNQLLIPRNEPRFLRLILCCLAVLIFSCSLYAFTLRGKKTFVGFCQLPIRRPYYS